MRRAGALALLVVALAVTQVAGATGQFVEHVQVLYTIQGTTPPNNCNTACFGWAGSELGDVDRDHTGDWITSEPFTTNGSTYVYSGRSGRELYRFDGAVAGAQQGYAIADAGDVDRDHVTDILTTAPGDGPGHVYVYSGRTGKLIHDLAGENAGDFFGSAVASAGDVDRDHRADILVGAERNAEAALNAGRVYVFSGRTGGLIRELQVGDQGDLFGSAVDWTKDLNRDRVPDHIVGARGGGLVGPGNGPGRVYVFSGRTGERLFDIPARSTSQDLGYFFVAGVGDVNKDQTPDVYAADFNDSGGTGRAGVYSGRNGSELLSWVGEPGAGFGPGREAGDVNRDGRPDIAVGSYTSSAGASSGGKIEIFSGRDGSLLRSITSLTANEQLGFDAVGIGDVNRDQRADLLATAANGETVYVIAGEGRGRDDE